MHLLKLVSREVIINYKLIAWRLPFLIFIAIFPTLHLASSPSLSLLVAASVAINFLVGMITFIQVFLSEHKNNDLRLLLVLQVDKKHIVDSKMIFITLLSILINIPLVLPIAFAADSLSVVCNAFTVDVLISSMIGCAMLLLYIRTNFESFMTLSQYVRWASVLSFMLGVSMMHPTASGIVSALQFNPLLAVLGFAGLWYLADSFTRKLLLARKAPF